MFVTARSSIAAEDLDGVIDGIVLYGAQDQPMRRNQAAIMAIAWDRAPIDPLESAEAERFASYDCRLGDVHRLSPEQTPLHRALAGETIHALPGAFRRHDA
jgi:hypothetical protein